MAEVSQRRSPRLALELPIRVIAFDFTGREFVEDSTTIVVNRHGAKIRLTRQLIPDQEVRILCRQSKQEAIFRVVGQAGGVQGEHSYWGVECTKPSQQIWGIDFPALAPNDQTSVRVMLRCPECRTRELLYVSEPLLESIRDAGGLVRGCEVCGRSALWQQVPYWSS